jgi:DNA mismatch repair protein MutS2
MKKHLTTLEFPKILERLAQHTAFSASKALALALQPTPFLVEAQAWQAETTEACHLLSVKPNLGIGGAHDVRPSVKHACREGTLSPADLLQIRQTLIVARELQRTITRLAEAYPRLADIAGRIEPCSGVISEIGDAIDDRGEVKSSASPALARIRRELEVAHGRLMDKLNRIITSTQYSQYLQEALITQRAGRYVIPVKADFKGRIQGVVHDLSASGATIFVEPLTTVELNNRWRKLQLDEADEIRRILAELSMLVGQQARYINHTVDALADLDLAFAKAKYAGVIEAVEPNLVNLNGQAERKQTKEKGSESVFDLIAARHPLLDPETVVPIDVSLPEDTRMLVITGPNTGGKTVSLKTVGLLAAMAQAGLRIPAAEGSTLPVFNHILADIGDEQSIEQSLSTFSAHMTNLVQILEQCDQRSLVILDELGAGTDPIEGSALARAILSNLLQRRVITFVATHYSELKAYAHTTAGVANASMEFDLDSLAPTFRLRIGLPGASNAFAIAQRLGLSADIINSARGLVGEETRQIEAMLAEIKAQTAAARKVRRQAEAEREQAEAYTRERERRLAEVDAERREILNSVRADARREIKAMRQEIRELKAKAEAELQALREAATQEQTRQAQPQESASVLVGEAEPNNVAEIETRLDELEAGIVTEAAPHSTPAAKERDKSKLSGPIRPGDKVFVQQFGTIGDVLAMQNKQVEVQLGHFRTTVPLAGVELRERATSPEPELSQKITVPPVESPGMELDLRGQVTEEALYNLDQYLDQAFLAHLPWVHIIHGKGSGVLRQAVRQELRNHPLVTSFRAGEEGEGGEGVTVAKLALS